MYALFLHSSILIYSCRYFSSFPPLQLLPLLTPFLRIFLSFTFSLSLASYSLFLYLSLCPLSLTLFLSPCLSRSFCPLIPHSSYISLNLSVSPLVALSHFLSLSFFLFLGISLFSLVCSIIMSHSFSFPTELVR